MFRHNTRWWQTCRRTQRHHTHT